MRVKFLQDYKHTIKSFHEGDIVTVHHTFGNELLKDKIATDKISRREIKKLEQIGKETKDVNRSN